MLVCHMLYQCQTGVGFGILQQRSVLRKNLKMLGWSFTNTEGESPLTCIWVLEGEADRWAIEAAISGRVNEGGGWQLNKLVDVGVWG